MATQNSSRRSHRALALPMLAAATLFAVTACGSDETADDQVLDVDTDQADDVADTVDDVVDTVGDVVDSAGSDVDETSDDHAQTLRDNGLDSIAAVVDQVDVSEWLGEGSYTFFAPNNEAFLGLEAEETADLLTDHDQILDVLRNHTLEDAVSADELVAMQTVETEAGSTLEVATDGDEVRLGDVTVVSTDIEVGDGVIHVVDGLLLP